MGKTSNLKQLPVHFGYVFKRITGSILPVTEILDMLIVYSERIVHNFSFDRRLYRFQQKKVKTADKLFLSIKILEWQNKSAAVHTVKESSGVPEVCVSQNRRKHVLWNPPYDCVYTFNFSLQCKL